MKTFLVFVIGLYLGAWCSSPTGIKFGYDVGVWTRNIFNESNDHKSEGK